MNIENKEYYQIDQVKKKVFLFLEKKNKLKLYSKIKIIKITDNIF
jgi:hypothetical protein